MKQKAVKKKKRKQVSLLHKAGIFAAVFLGVVLLFALLSGAAWLLLKTQGKASFARKQEAVPEQMAAGMDEQISENDADKEEPLEAGAIRYQGKTYVYKEDVLTFLCMGIDKSGEVKASANLFKGGQADAIFLVVLDNVDKKIRLIGIHRNTMTEMDVFDQNGLYAGKELAQIALAHAYGEGTQSSCENTVKAVSDLFYGLPIHGYCSLNMDVMVPLNDAVGGVDVVIPGSAAGANYGKNGKVYDTGWKEGDQVHLTGDDVYAFVRYRDWNQTNSAGDRMERQKQYLNAFITQARAAMQKDMTLPLKLYNLVTPYMVTDITAEEAVYLAGEALSYQFSKEDICSLAGKVTMGEQFEEFYVDDTALYELILEIFYEEE